MKKLVLSAFAMSLIILSTDLWAQSEGVDEFLGLENELLPELKGEQRFTTPELHGTSSWKVLPENAIKDITIPAKGQGYSIIPWSELDPSEWMNISTWLNERELKDKTPDWKLRLRLHDQKELMGKILQCKGICEVYRGSEKANVQHLSRLLEGDEIRTEKDSVAWIFMMDGSLLRLSPGSSLSLHEVNIGKSDFFFLLRLNEGHVFWHPRSKSELALDLSPETDSLSLPLMVRESNLANFERKIYQSQTTFERLTELMDLDENAIKAQFKSINEMKEELNKTLTLGTKLMLVAPNASLVARDVSFDMAYIPGGKSYFKKRTGNVGEEFSLLVRGYSNTQSLSISEQDWFEVESSGRVFSPLTDIPATLQVLELLTKRIKTIELAREIWARDFTGPLVIASQNPEKLAQDFGYHRWGDEMDQRYNFLVEYTRRIETTNLRAVTNLLNKLEKNGEKVVRDLSEDQYRVSLNHYLLGLKNRYDHKNMKVREMNDLQFYVWILKNGKL